MKETLAKYAVNDANQPPNAYGRFHSTRIPAVPVARPNVPATSSLPLASKKSLTGGKDRALDKSRITVFNNNSKYPSLPPVAGANTKVKDQSSASGFDPSRTQNTEGADYGALTAFQGVSEDGKEHSTVIPAKAAKSHHVGDLPLIAPFRLSSPPPSTALSTWQKFLAMRMNRN